MASTTNSVPSTNGGPGNAVNNQMPQNAASTRPTLRTSTGPKGSDGGRRQSGSPVDGSQRRSNPPKAWTQNTNPITQKPNYPHQNGGAAHRKSTMSSKPTSTKESNTPDMHAHDRLVFIMTACIGMNATITTKGGEKYTGIFSSSLLESNATSFMLKMVQRCPSSEKDASSNGLSDRNSPFLGSAPDHQMTFEVQDVADLSVPELSAVGMAVKSQNGASVGFKTDTDISGGQPGRERELQRWEPGPDTEVDLSLESTSTTHWDQFEANARLFGATSSYDENLYTTRIDRSDPSYKQKEAQAARIAREIESSDTDNVHMREERGLAPENDNIGEEEKYSGVRRDNMNFPPLQSGQPNKYTPPARRAPTAQPTVTGAPVDPAIISAQMARPDAQAKPSQAKNLAPPVAKPTEAPQDKGTEAAKAAPPGKLATDLKPSTTSGKPTAATTDQPTRKGGVENASSNVETEVLDHFRQFANNEKMKLQERRRNQASYDRNLKLNELLKFSQNFKLRTPVPKDLVPILAKDRSKQEEIVAKAMREAEEKKASEKAAASAPATEQKPAPRPNGQTQYNVNTAPLAPSDRQPYPRGRQGFPPMGPHFGRGGGHQQTAHPRSGPGHLSHRLADIQQQRKGAGMGPVPPPLSTQDARAPPKGPMADHSGVASPPKPLQSPTSAVSTKFNVRALEFKPNPTASSFTPGGATPNASSPALNARTRSISRTTSPSAFFGNRKPLPASERPSIKDHFNPIKRMKKEASEQTTKDYAFNGGIPPAYRTLPTWDVPQANEEMKYTDLFKPAASAPPMMPQNRPASNPPMPHQPHMPYNQAGGHNMPPNAGPPYVNQHLQPHHHPASGPPHYDEHQNRMQMSASSSQAYPSPRLQQSHMAYQSPMAPHAQLAYGQPGPQFYASQGPHPPHMRHYPGGPQFVPPQNGVGAPMMVQQPSSGPYMGVPQGMGTPYNPPVHMYSPGTQHTYPQHVQPPPHPHSGYPSPGRGAPMMMHQGSQQGQPPQPVMYMNPNQHGQPAYPGQQPAHMPPVRPGYPQHQQPHFQSSPHQGHHYPHQQRVQSNNYNQVPHMPPPHMQPQGPPQNPPAAHHPAEVPEEVK